jgi:hypothetical protein
VEETTGYRRKQTQTGRTDWIKTQVDAHSTALRYYERKPRPYSALSASVEESGQSQGESPEETGRRDRAWGFWKSYEEKEGKRVLAWKKTILYKKGRSSREDARGLDKPLSWDRTKYLVDLREVNARRSLSQTQRLIRELPTRSVQAKSKGKPVVERRRQGPGGASTQGSREPRRQRTYEGLQSPEERPRVGLDAEGVDTDTRLGYTVWDEVRKLVPGNLYYKKTRRKKRKFKLMSFEKQKEKRESLKSDYFHREERRLRNRDSREVVDGKRETRRKEKSHKGKKRKTFVTKRKATKKKALVWSPYGNRRRRYGVEVTGHLRASAEGAPVRKEEERKKRGRCQSG